MQVLTHFLLRAHHRVLKIVNRLIVLSIAVLEAADVVIANADGFEILLLFLNDLKSVARLSEVYDSDRVLLTLERITLELLGLDHPLKHLVELIDLPRVELLVFQVEQLTIVAHITEPGVQLTKRINDAVGDSVRQENGNGDGAQ